MRTTPDAPVRRSTIVAAGPRQASLRADRARVGMLSLVVVPRGTAVPVLLAGEDWVWSDASEQEVAERLRDLDRFARSADTTGEADPVVVLPTDLGADEHRVAARLIASVGTYVPRSDLPVEDLDAVVTALETVLAQLGWATVAVDQEGLVLVPASRRER